MDITFLGTGAVGVQDPAFPGMDVPVSSLAQRNVGWFGSPSYIWGKDKEENEGKEKDGISALLTQALSISPHQEMRGIHGLPAAGCPQLRCRKRLRVWVCPQATAGGHTGRDGRACCCEE